MSGELFLLKSVPVNSFLSIRFDLFNVSLSLCTSFLPVEDTMKANHTDSQITLPPLPTGLYGCISRARDRSLMWGAGKKHYNHKVLQLVQPQKDALRETELLQRPLSFSGAVRKSGRDNDSASHNFPPRLFHWALNKTKNRWPGL